MNKNNNRQLGRKEKEMKHLISLIYLSQRKQRDSLSFLRHLPLALILMGQLHWAQAATKAADFKPTRASLSKYEVPEWYHDAKIGFFYHWGPQSVVGDKFSADALNFLQQKGKYAGTAKKNPPGQWGATMYPKPGKPDSEQNSAYILHRKWFGDPKEFGYKEFIPLMTGKNFDPEYMVKLLDEAGVKYITPMAVHHDGFAMWDSKVIDKFNAAKMGPKKDTTRLVIEAARRRGIKAGVSTHVCRHSWYYSKVEGYDCSDPRYVQLYGEGQGPGGIPKPEAMKKWEATLGELVDLFHPDYIFVDGGTADTYTMKKSYVVQESFRRIVANAYNSGLKHGYEPVVSFKRESLYKEEAVPDYEGGNLIGIAPYKWQTHSSISGWFYRPGRPCTKTHILFRKILDVVSKNGNMLLNLAIKGDGSMQEYEIAYLKDMAKWMNVVGESIHATRPWLIHGETESTEIVVGAHHFKGIVYNDLERVKTGNIKIYEDDIRYTRSKDKRTIYVSRMSFPKKAILLKSFSNDGPGSKVKIKSIKVLGSDEKVDWKRSDEGIKIQPLKKSIFQAPEWPVVFSMSVK